MCVYNSLICKHATNIVEKIINIYYPFNLIINCEFHLLNIWTCYRNRHKSGDDKEKKIK